MQRSANWKWMTGVAGLAAGLIMAGCTLGPRYRTPAPPTVTVYTPQPLPAETASSKDLRATRSTLFNQRRFPRTGGLRFSRPI